MRFIVVEREPYTFLGVYAVPDDLELDVLNSFLPENCVASQTEVAVFGDVAAIAVDVKEVLADLGNDS